MLKFAILLYIFLFSSFSSCTAVADHLSDLSALLSLNLLSRRTGDHCSWPEITCNARRRVVAINFASPAKPRRRFDPFRRRSDVLGQPLVGKLTAEVGRLSELRVLSLPFQGFAGVIPDEIWGLRKLQVLDLEGNRLQGRLPARFPARLRVLNLASNLISGDLPGSLFARSVDLQVIVLSRNRLSGNIPSGFITSLPKLRELYLSGNSFTGSIPEDIGSGCVSLQHLDISVNSLTGRIPSSLGNCSQLENLILFLNLLDGFVPPELGRLKKLQVLDVSRNSLTGFVPQELGSCLELSVLVLSNLFDPLFGRDSLEYADRDEFNHFQGRLPEKITALPTLRVLWAPRAMLQGDLPNNWGNCQNLEIVNLGQNQFTGQIPESFDGCRNIKFMNLSSNNLAGQLSKELPVPCMDVFDVSNNHISGSIPLFSADQCSLYHFSDEDLSSTYVSFFFHKSRVRVALPFFTDGDLFTVYHSFGTNNFAGTLQTLPVSTRKYGDKTVYAFFADGNNLTGSFNGSFLDNCNQLNGLIVNLSKNILSGDIASDIGARCRALVALDLSHNSISGIIPSSLGLLGKLIELDLSRNFFKGQIPKSFEKLKSMEYLSLGNNNLTGKIPSGLGQLQALKFLDLSSNSLTGEIPCDVMNLSNLSVLLLGNNKLSGNIPSSTTTRVTSFSMFDASFNNFSGPLPLNARMVACSSSQGNPLLNSSSLTYFRRASLLANSQNPEADTSASQGNSTSNNGSNGFSSIEIASITSASSIVAVLLALVVLYIYTRKCAPRSSVRSAEKKEVTVVVDIGVPITYDIVVQATRGFNASNCIGSGGFGATYKAEIAPGVLVAIKRLAIGRFQGAQQFQAEIKTLGIWRHPNLVTLIGHHISDSEMFLIYNYLPGGNLERFIQERHKRPVDWRMLHKIALDVARALSYLHEQNPRILHRDVKPSNILLDNDFNAYLSDFGLARLMGTSETHATTGVAGTFGYVAPEYAMTCRVSDKADVYSYGVVLLELISDKKALDPSFSPYGNGFNIVTWASMLLHKGRPREFFAEGLWNAAPHDDLVETLDIGIKCTVDSLSIRPTMKEVVRRLKELHPPTC